MLHVRRVEEAKSFVQVNRAWRAASWYLQFEELSLTTSTTSSLLLRRMASDVELGGHVRKVVGGGAREPERWTIETLEMLAVYCPSVFAIEVRGCEPLPSGLPPLSDRLVASLTTNVTVLFLS